MTPRQRLIYYAARRIRENGANPDMGNAHRAIEHVALHMLPELTDIYRSLTELSLARLIYSVMREAKQR